MLNKEDLRKHIEEVNKDRKSTFAEFIDKLFHGKFIEIYLGDSYEEISTDQVSMAYPAVFCGRVEGAYREVLIIDSAFIDQKTRKMKLGNFMFINERAIRALNEVDNFGSLGDMFLRSREALDVTKALSINEK